MPPPPPPAPTLRPATESDLPALLALLLTSFRQFPLFRFLYAPLDSDLSAANDTVFFWRRRLLRELLDPSVSVVIAEVVDDGDGGREQRRRGHLGGGDGEAQGATGDGQQQRQQQQQMTEVEKESWRMLEWVVARGGLSQASMARRGCLVVGFAIWGVRVGHAAGGEERERLGGRAVDLRTALRVKALDFESYVWSKIYQRRDQDPARYAAYLAAEEELSERFYAKSCYYLDNLCVDFRYQRLGIGGKLLEWGIETAKGKGLGVQTEAGPMGEGLYRKMGFKQVDVWGVTMVGVKEVDGKGDEGERMMYMPVMRRELGYGE